MARSNQLSANPDGQAIFFARSFEKKGIHLHTYIQWLTKKLTVLYISPTQHTTSSFARHRYRFTTDNAIRTASFPDIPNDAVKLGRFLICRHAVTIHHAIELGRVLTAQREHLEQFSTIGFARHGHAVTTVATGSIALPSTRWRHDADHVGWSWLRQREWGGSSHLCQVCSLPTTNN